MGSLKFAGMTILLGLLPQLRAQSTVILIDYSGSMKPYYEMQSVQQLVRMLMSEAVQKEGAELAIFSTDVTSLQDLGELASHSLGRDTYLDRAVDYALNGGYAIAWIITDNIQDPANSAVVGNTEDFYDRLQEEAVRKVTIFPLLQAQGTPGLVAYGLQLDASAGDAYEKQILSLLAAAEGRFKMEALRMKPLDRETVVIRVVEDERPEGKPQGRYAEGDHVSESLKLRFLSKFEHLKIENAEIEVSQSRAGFPPDSVLVPEKNDISISPVTVDLGPGEESQQIYEVNFDLGKVRIKKDLASLWKAAFSEAWEKPVLVLSLRIRVPQSNFRFKESFLSEYSAASPDAAKATGKVYGIEGLPVLLGGESTLILSEQEIPIRIDYPWWPAFLFIAAFVALAAVAGGVIWFLKPLATGLLSRSRWTVEASTGTGRSLDCEVSAQGQVSIDGASIGVIQGSTFETDPGVEVIGSAAGSGRVELESGRNVQLRHPKLGSLILTFHKPGGGEQEEASALPSRR